MQYLNRILWSLAILFISVTTVIFSFGILLIGVAAASIFGIYRYYFTRKRSEKFQTCSNKYTYGEVIDVSAEVIPQTIQSRKSDI